MYIHTYSGVTVVECPSVEEDVESRVGAVSYTHLDVYKRQRQTRI